MSFFDDEGDPPRPGLGARAAGAGAAAPRAGRAPRPTRTRGPDHRTARQRRLLALGALGLLLLLLIVGVGQCASNAGKNGLRRYTDQVTALGRDSDTQVGAPLFALLSGRGPDGRPTRSPQELQSGVDQLKATAEQQLARARRLDVPDQVRGAQRALRFSLGLRAEGVRAIGQQIPAALDRRRAARATELIAGQGQALLAADVLFSQRVAPLIGQALRGEGVGDRQPPRSQWVKRPLDALNPRTVAARLTGDPAAGGGKPAPGLHGHGLTGVSLGAVTLRPNAPNTLPAGTPATLTVRFQNQGNNTEREVRVRVRISGGPKPITAEQTVPETAANAQASADLALEPAPPAGIPLTVDVEVAGVPGERKLDNNKQTFTVQLSR